MQKRDYADCAAGGVLTALGLGAAIYAFGHYDMGTFSNMGSGLFPAVLGALLALLGLGILVPALGRQGTMPAIEWRSASAVLAGTLAFALLVDSFGMVPAIFAMAGVTSLADRKLKPLVVIIFAALMALFCVIVFRIGLGMPIPVFAWPF